MSNDVMITTSDNPFNPFEQWNDWLNWDHRMGYNTCETLARIANTTNALSDDVNEEEINTAMDSMIEFAPTIFVKLYRPTANQTLKAIQKAN